MFEEDSIEQPQNHLDDLGFFIFNKNQVRVVLYKVRNLKGEEAFGFLSAFSDVEQKVGGIIRNSVPAMNSSITKGYDSQRKLWNNFSRVRDMTVNRPNFDFLWEGMMNWG